MLFAPALLALASQTPVQPLATLVPRDTVVYVQVSSLDSLLAGWRRTRAAFDPEEQSPIDVEHLWKELDLPGALAEIDTGRPMALCVTLAPGNMDSSVKPVFLVPARSPENFLKSLSTPEHKVTALVDGSYVLVAPESETIERGTSPAAIALGLPSGALVARIDLGRILDQYRPMLEPALAELGQAGEEEAPSVPAGIDDRPMLRESMNGMRDFFASAQTLDIAVRLEGSRMELGLDLTNKAGSVLAEFGSKEKTDARALARFFDTGSAINVLAGMDMQALTRRFGPLWKALPEMYPEPLRSGVGQLFGHLDDVGAQLGNALCASADFGSDGLRISYVLRARDAAKLIASYKSMLANSPGLQITAPEESSLDGVAVTSWRIQLDPKALADAKLDEQQQKQLPELIKRLYGPDGLRVRIAPKGDLCVLVLGGDDAFLKSALARAGAAPPSLPAGVQRALDQVGNMSPCFVMHCDLGKLTRGIASVVESFAPESADEVPELPFSILAWGGVEGAVWHGALGCELDEVAAAMRAVAAEHAAKQRQLQALAGVQQLSVALQEYAQNHAGKYPEKLTTLAVKDEAGHSYVYGEQALLDPWAREFRYEPPRADHPKPRVLCLGRDGKPGGTGEDEDVDSDAR